MPIDNHMDLCLKEHTSGHFYYKWKSGRSYFSGQALEGVTPSAGPVTIEVSRIKLNSQGYTRTGQYYGSGMNLYQVYIETPNEVGDFEIRAPHANVLKKALRSLYESPQQA